MINCLTSLVYLLSLAFLKFVIIIWFVLLWFLVLFLIPLTLLIFSVFIHTQSIQMHLFTCTSSNEIDQSAMLFLQSYSLCRIQWFFFFIWTGAYRNLCTKIAWKTHAYYSRQKEMLCRFLQWSGLGSFYSQWLYGVRPWMGKYIHCLGV